MPTPIRNAFDVRVGCDVQSIDAVLAAIDESGDRYLRRILGDGERAEAARLTSPELIARYTSGRFAAKEAVYKALRVAPDVSLGWPQIEVLADETGAPRVRVSGTAADVAAAAGIGEIAVSISHTELFAFAVATAVAVTP